MEGLSITFSMHALEAQRTLPSNGVALIFSVMLGRFCTRVLSLCNLLYTRAFLEEFLFVQHLSIAPRKK